MKFNLPKLPIKITRHGQPHKKFWCWLLIIFLIMGYGLYTIKWAKHYPYKIDLKIPTGWLGVTYSKKFATEIGLDWRVTYLAMLDDLKVKNLRLPIYWDEVESKYGVWNFSDYDFMVNEAAKRQVKLVINIGARLPRWPECHLPAWANGLPIVERQAATISMLETVVQHYQNNPAIIDWQVENEPLLNVFGECPQGDPEFLRQEVLAVRKIDSRPIIISASGELSWWTREGEIGDLFGTTMYRVVWGPWSGYFRYPFPAIIYRFKAWRAGIAQNRRLIMELQTEPWVPAGSLKEMSAAEANKSFNLEQFKANVQYALNTKFKRAYLWGVEYWYLKKQQGDPRYWDLARELFNQN